MSEKALKIDAPDNSHSLQKLQAMLLEEQEYSSMLKSALDLAYEGIVIVDAQARITAMSKAYLEFLGLDEESAIGRKVQDVIENTRMHVVVQTGKAEEAQLQKIKGRYMIANRHPIIVDGRIVGAVGKVLFRNVKDLDYLYKKYGRVLRELEEYKEEIQQQYSARYSFANIIGVDPLFVAARQLAQKSAMTDSNVLLLGESGTGKELFAHAIHRASSRGYGYFIKVNCAAIPADLLESELFGYEKGAFTGASKEGKMGKFELADGGTIFLDEIGDMPLHMQAKLLRVLQEKEVERLGSVSTRNVDIRIIAATNQDLEKMVAEHRFRADLYYRLNVVTIRIPSLRERREDIPLLTNHLTRVKSAKLSLPERTVSDRTMEYLKSYHWEGNIRQLENVVERAINIMEGEEEIILPRHLPKEITGFERDFRVELLSDTVARAEREAIMSAIEYCKGNKLKAAKLLGISRNALYDRLNRQKDDTKIRK